MKMKSTAAEDKAKKVQGKLLIVKAEKIRGNSFEISFPQVHTLTKRPPRQFPFSN